MRCRIYLSCGKSKRWAGVLLGTTAVSCGQPQAPTVCEPYRLDFAPGETLRFKA